jgi:hypothetical protein
MWESDHEWWMRKEVGYLMAPTCPEEKDKNFSQTDHFTAMIQMKVGCYCCYVFCVYNKLADALESHLIYSHQLP